MRLVIRQHPPRLAAVADVQIDLDADRRAALDA
jgi:hypothetical protein